MSKQYVYRKTCNHFTGELPDFCKILNTTPGNISAYAKDCSSCSFYITKEEYIKRLKQYPYNRDYKPTSDNSRYRQVQKKFLMKYFEDDE